MSNDIPRAVVAGHLCLDIIPGLSGLTPRSASEFFEAGRLRFIGPATLATGGPVSNTGLALVRLGIDTALMGKVGDDPFGSMIRLILAEWGVTEGIIVVEGEASSYTVILDPPALDRMFLHLPGTNDTFSADDVRYDLVAERGLFHFGYPPLLKQMYQDDGAQLVQMFQRVKELGVTTSLDMAMPDPTTESGRADWLAILESVMPYVDIFLPSAEEILYMMERGLFEALQEQDGPNMMDSLTGDDLHRLSGRLLDMGGKVVGIKCGFRGVYVRTCGQDRMVQMGKVKPADTKVWANREIWHPSFVVEYYAGGTGAGDSTIAGFLSGFLRGHPLDESLRYACANGAFNVTAPDALGGLRPWEEVVRRVEEGWQKNALTVQGNGWQRRDDGAWVGPADAA